MSVNQVLSFPEEPTDPEIIRAKLREVTRQIGEAIAQSHIARRVCGRLLHTVQTKELWRADYDSFSDYIADLPRLLQAEGFHFSEDEDGEIAAGLFAAQIAKVVRQTAYRWIQEEDVVSAITRLAERMKALGIAGIPDPLPVPTQRAAKFLAKLDRLEQFFTWCELVAEGKTASNQVEDRVSAKLREKQPKQGSDEDDRPVKQHAYSLCLRMAEADMDAARPLFKEIAGDYDEAPKFPQSEYRKKGMDMMKVGKLLELIGQWLQQNPQTVFSNLTVR